MQISINGDEQNLQLASGASLQDLLDLLEMGKGRIAIEANGEIIPRSSFTSHILNDGDSLEIVQAIGGG